MKTKTAAATALLLFVLLLSVCSKKEPPIEYEPEDDFVIEITDNKKGVRIARYLIEEEDKGVVNIPSRIKGLPVTEIGPSSMADRFFFKARIPDTVTNIMNFAFSGNFLNDVIIPKRVTEIGPGAFMNNELTEIIIPDNVKKIGYRAFCNNPLETVTIGENVELGTLEGWDANNEHWKYTAFEGTGFDDFYEGNYRKGGTFIKNNGMWIEKTK